MSWYYAQNGQRLGPISELEFENLVQAGAVQPSTLVWRNGMPEWRTFEQVQADRAAAGASTDTAICAVSGKRLPKREMIQYDGHWISTEHKDTYFQRVRQGAAQPGPMNYAGFGVRFLAKVIDIVLLYLVAVVVNIVVSLIVFDTPNYFTALGSQSLGKTLEFEGISFILGIMTAVTYAILFISRYDATPGKMALGLKILRPDGSSLSVGQIVGRYFAEILSSLILCIGYLMVIGDAEARALHDRICDTRVVRARSAR